MPRYKVKIEILSGDGNVPKTGHCVARALRLLEDYLVDAVAENKPMPIHSKVLKNVDGEEIARLEVEQEK